MTFMLSVYLKKQKTVWSKGIFFGNDQVIGLYIVVLEHFEEQTSSNP